MCYVDIHAEGIGQLQAYEGSKMQARSQANIPSAGLGAHGMSGGCSSLNSSLFCLSAWCLPRTYCASLLLLHVLLCLQLSGVLDALIALLHCCWG